VQSAVVKKLMELAGDETASSLVRAEAADALRGVLALVRIAPSAHRRQVRDDVTRFLNRPDSVRPLPRALPTPAGDPIGGK
jgi:hypothetical protein